MLVAISSARAQPGRRGELVSQAQQIADASRQDDGCRSYDFYADLTDPDVVVCVEVWADQAALDAHMDHGHTRDFLRAVPGLVSGEPVMTVLSEVDPLPVSRSEGELDA